ncbi:MAG: methionine biosynthesis protein MetW [Candidatus Glassbacteria bacterium]
MRGLVYLHPLIYRTFMRIIYRGQFELRYKKIAELIPDGSVVNDICCGDGYIYSKYLRSKKVSYHGFDNNPSFIRWLRANGIKSSLLDIYHDPLPSGDILLLQASLYQFIPEHESLLKKLLASIHKKIIISEPITNLSSNKSRLISKFAQWMSATEKGPCRERFDREKLMELFAKFGASEVINCGRDIMGVFLIA